MVRISDENVKIVSKEALCKEKFNVMVITTRKSTTLKSSEFVQFVRHVVSSDTKESLFLDIEED